MGAEVGATTSVFPLTQKMLSYLKATGRQDIAAHIEESRSVQQYLAADDGMMWNAALCSHSLLKGCTYDRVIDINLDQLEPHINGPFSPDIATPLSKMKEATEQNGWPENIRVHRSVPPCPAEYLRFG